MNRMSNHNVDVVIHSKSQLNCQLMHNMLFVIFLTGMGSKVLCPLSHDSYQKLALYKSFTCLLTYLLTSTQYTTALKEVESWRKR